MIKYMILEDKNVEVLAFYLPIYRIATLAS